MKNLNGEKFFSVSIGQRLLSGVVVLNLLVLSFFIFTSSRFTAAESRVFSSTQTTSNSISITQREILVYTTKFAQWMGGQLPKREVQLARAFLAQRLSVINPDGMSSGELSVPQFIDELRESAAILNQAPDGLLPQTLQKSLTERSNKAILGLLFSSRQLTMAYQAKLDSEILESRQQQSRNILNNLIALVLFIVLLSGLFLWSTVSFKNQYRSTRVRFEEEEKELLTSATKLQESEVMVKTLQELDITKSDFISTVNHELRTPLTSIIGFIDVLKALDIEKDADQLPLITTVIDRNSEVLLDIIESILSLSNLDSNDKVPRFESIGLIQIIERKIFVLTPLLNQKSIVVNFNHSSIDDFVVLGNAGQLSQVVLNLVSNAIKFSPDKSTIEISLTVISKNLPQDFIQLEVKDQGMGIPKDEIPKLFTRFFRASNAVASQVSGTGLGLSIVARILELHHANIRVESEVDKGSSFIVEFPRNVTETDQLISKNRSNVLFKAIVALKDAQPDELINVSHQMSGTLGFYDLEKEMHLISDFQSWLESKPDDLDALLDSKRTELVTALEVSYSHLDVGMDRKQ